MSHATNQTILIVDDMPTNVEVLAGALMKAGYQVAVALDGESAITQIQYKSPALVLLDVMMPGIDGFETCRRLKDSPKTQAIPIIFMTALSETVNKSKGFSLGAVDYITKPFDAQEVLARVDTHLRLHQLTTELEATVESRTAELTLALEQLQQTQTQLIQSERMSLVGEISAGIAYEMSNPVNYIRGNLRHLETSLMQLLEFAEDVHPQLQLLKDSDEATRQATLTQLSEATLDLDLDFVREDLPKILGSFNRGTNKIQQLISNLRTFADSDKSGRQTVDVHELVESCLSLLGHKLQAKTRRNTIQVNKDYQSIPKIKCYPAALSQALIGILLSYIARLAVTKNDETSALPQISVQTSCQSDDWVVIKLSIGISQIFSTSSALYNTQNNDTQSEKEQLLANPDDMNLILAHGILTRQHQGRLHHQTKDGHTFVIMELPVEQVNPVASEKQETSIAATTVSHLTSESVS